MIYLQIYIDIEKGDNFIIKMDATIHQRLCMLCICIFLCVIIIVDTLENLFIFK